MKDFVLQQGVGGVWFGLFTHFLSIGVKHGISTRLGGVSRAPYQSLNLGLHVGDDSVCVEKNRRLFCNAVGVNSEAVVAAEQIHGDKIAVITHEQAGKGAFSYKEAIAGTDALVTNVPGVPLLLCYADCVPVCIVDPVQEAIGVIHAGWKGTVSKIVQKTLAVMGTQYGTKADNCLVGIGPSIGPCCYQVNETVLNPLKNTFPNWIDLVKNMQTGTFLNLWEANRCQLIDVGVHEERVVVSQVCTACNTSIFFSHRREAGATGRMGALLQFGE